ncbi:cysteine desulfurase family protein [Mesorhizobium sp. B2-3-6]|uniref:cysteine desulfurase family protein n=1 Tax=Mesorhizobium sp. B2-3-6 TaxID=2589957 RepID=UPI001127044C|nr:cysteine desulfurase family protein [Mesorhizobium sp. B2-3-6]TPM23829.1 cysteine desulfurase [Mesorhizobium sp. B2-3-6]
MEINAYLDNNATTRPHREVIEAVRYYQETLFLNASSTAGELLGAARPLREARIAMLGLLGGEEDADQIVLTSGASEANSWVMFGALAPGSHGVISASEHSSILHAARSAQARGHHIDVLEVNEQGLIDGESLAAALRPETRLVSIHMANNETGAIQPLASLGVLVRELAPSALFHTDATQAVGRLAIDLSNAFEQVDLLSFSAHKFHGPKGIGGLFIRSGVAINALISGEQEKGLRGGTSNVPGAAGLAVAARLATAGLDQMAKVAQLRDQLEARLVALRPDAVVHSRDAPRLPNTSSISFPQLLADDATEQLALRGICIATGSACTAGATAPSHVLTAMGVSLDDARATLRFSLSIQTTQVEVDRTILALQPFLSSPA